MVNVPVWLRRRVRVLSLAGGMLLALGLVLAGVGIEVTSRPTFCGTCHIMKPYYESWKISGHNKVACVECHIAPGVTAELRKKYEALSMVAKYFTATYGTNPWAEVEDAACLRCHERRLLEGKVIYKGVRFDHTPHLIQMRRGKQLRCTSCHSQIVQGAHVAVTSTTCVLCHFKGEQPGEGTSRCTICHEIPTNTVTVSGVTFKHVEVKDFGMKCTWCHLNASTGDGAVPRERCLTCHNEPARLTHYGEGELLHLMHVTQHKVDCLNCHLEIQHGRAQVSQTSVPDCSTCHASGHSAQQQLYSGTGGKNTGNVPSAMFVSGVRCEGCHTLRRGVVDYASVVSCMACHGATYMKIYESWRAILKQATAEVERDIEEGRSKLGALDPAVRDAAANVDLVRRGNGIHNVPYALALFDGARAGLNAAMKAKGMPVREVVRRGYKMSPCYVCHQGIEYQKGSFGTVSFAHERHLVSAALSCQSCHRPHEERAAGEVVRFGIEGCRGCHHVQVKKECKECHATLPAEVDHEGKKFSHELHTGEAGLSCTDCHVKGAGGAMTLNKETCAPCHEG